ncbi:MAG: substrate-binding domain-containing protein, partial [Terriglobia bacterium]
AVLTAAIAIVALAGCSSQSSTLILATTTSTYDTGLLDRMLPAFERKHGVTVKVIAVGTGEALALGRKGNADVVLVHAPRLEREFEAAGFGINRKQFMHNFFVLLGPDDDPARAGGAGSRRALRRIREREALFVSRGDNSGTHRKELDLWGSAGGKPRGDSYLETGLGMGDTLRVASEKGGYILSDTGTYLAQRDNLNLRRLTGKEPGLRNPYSIMAINHEKFANVNAVGAQQMIDWITSPEVQRTIRSFGVEKYGEALFVADLNR